MKKLIFPKPRELRSYKEKFGHDADPFGNGSKAPPQTLGSLPLLLLCALGGIALVVGVLLLGRLWKVTGVSATDGQLYSATVLVEYAEIEPGDEFLGFDAFAVEKQLRKSLPLLDRVKVKKHLSGEVTIEVTEITELYYTRHNQNYYILSAETHEVLCVAAAPTEARRVGAVYLGLPEATRVRVGEELSFINLPYDPETAGTELSTYEVETDPPEEENAYVFELVETLMATPLGARVVGMELSDRYDITVVLEGRIRIDLGDMEELERKLTLAERSLADKEESGGLPTDMPTLVDVSDPARIIHRTSPDVDMPDWAD